MYMTSFLISNCCSSPIITDASGPDVCSSCKEHCQGVEPECTDCQDSISKELYEYDPQYPLCAHCGYLAFKC